MKANCSEVVSLYTYLVHACIEQFDLSSFALSLLLSLRYFNHCAFTYSSSLLRISLLIGDLCHGGFLISVRSCNNSLYIMT